MGQFVYFLTLLLSLQYANAQNRVSSIAGSTQTFVFPPTGVTATSADPNFPDGTHVGFAGPTLTGDEAAAIATAPSFAHYKGQYPLVKPLAADAKHEKDFDVIRNFGDQAPWRSVPSSSFGLAGASPVVPNGCEIVQVHVLLRHGARNPSHSTSAFASKIHEAASSPSGFQAVGDLAFLQNWTYKLGEEILSSFGRLQIFNLGVAFRLKYGMLLKKSKDLPVFRTTSKVRLVDSMLNFAACFFGLPDYEKKYHQLIELDVRNINSSLSSPSRNCPNAHNEISRIGHERFSGQWKEQYLANALERLGGQMPGFNLTLADCHNMQQLCVYETLALGYSKFCKLFTEAEWKGFGYSTSLRKWYGIGPGSPVSAASGIGYVQELVSRLTKTRITDFNTNVNLTIVTNETLFPFDQPIYVDATHSSTMTAVYVAMNFTSMVRSGPLPTDRIPENLSYATENTIPTAANLVGQVLSCPASGTRTHIRWILNDGVLPLDGIDGCEYNKDGMCEINVFIAGMKQRIAEVDFAFGCFGNYTFPDPDLIVDGQLPRNLRH